MKAAAAFNAAVAAAAGLCAACTSANFAPGMLSGTSWRIAAVGGQPTPAAGDYSMRFDEDGSVGARFGCNHMGGSYRLAGSTLTVSNVHQTLMGCPEPAASFESRGAAVLGRPMRVDFSSKERMVLSNETGSIALDRVQ